MAAPAEDTRPTPYRDAAATYRAAGWVGVLPIPYRSKQLRAVGWTGHHGAWPSGADIAAWCDSARHDEGGGNIALRMSPGIIGVDVDNYGDKHGADDLAEAVRQWGPLPETWTSTARDDGISGIRLYRAPEGLRWPGQVGPSIEIIQTTHRYAVVWPSVHPEGRVYRWYRPDGVPSLAPPRVDEIPDLPDAWIAGLTGGELAEQAQFADLTSTEYAGWMGAHSGGHPCRAMQTVTDRLADEMRNGSAHDSLRRLMGLVRLAEQGHTGLATALTATHAAFVAKATDPARGKTPRTLEDAQGEWKRSLAGAVSRVLGSASIAGGDTVVDPCSQPFAGLVSPTGTPTAVSPTPTIAPTSGATALAPPAPHNPDPAPERDERDLSDLIAPTGGTGPAPEPVPVEHTSWWPRDLTAVLAGERTEPEPAVLARDDGQHLFYAGKVNGLLGESESGKSWLLLAAVVQCLRAGQPALYVDFEDTADSVVARLQAMGVDPALLGPDVGLFDYVAPDEALHAVAAADLAAVLQRADYALIGLDGVNAAMTLLGLDLSSNPDATKFAQVLLRPLARTGAAVVTVDHVGKDKETRGKGGIGAQAKRAMTTGCSIAVEVLSPFGRGQTGKLRLTVDKDRPGHVRGFAENSKNAGIAVLESGSNGSVNVRIEVPGSAAASAPVREPWRPTAAMEKITRLLSTTDGLLSQKQIEDAVSMRAATVRQALDVLVEEGYVSRHPGPRNALLHRYERTFRELDGLVAPPRTHEEGWG